MHHRDNLLNDIFVPELSLAFEYNGEYHYKSINMYLVSNFLLLM